MTPQEHAQNNENIRLRIALERAQADALREREAFTQQTMALLEQLARQSVQLERLSEQLARSNERIEELLAIVNRKKRPPAKEKPMPPPAPPPTLSEEQASAFSDRPAPPEVPEKEKHPKKRSRNGPNKLPAHLPVDETVCPAERCTCGSGALELVDEVVSEQLDVVQQHLRRRRIVQQVCRCKTCRRKVVGPPPPAPCEQSKVTCAWLAWLVVQKFHLLVPLDRIRRDLGLRGVPIAISYLVTAVERAADLLQAIDGEHWRQLKSGPWMQSDGTSLNVIVPGVEGTHKGYLEVYRRDELVVFQYEPSKDGERALAKLKGYRGLLVVDAESRFNMVFEKGSAVEAGCNAHGFRKFEAAQAVQPTLAVEGAAFLTAAFVKEAEARDAGLVGEALRTWRQEQIAPIYQRFRRWMDAVLPSLLPDDRLAGAIRYYHNHWPALTRFIDHPAIPMDNSGAEREFQTVAKARLSWLFAGSTEGAHRAAILLGVIATARNLGVDPQAYLTWVFERTGTHKGHFKLAARDLTPAAYRAAHPPPVPS